MILVLYGPDTYRSRRKLNEIIEEYRHKSGSNLNFQRFDAGEDSVKKIKDALQSGSLFAEKKLAVVEGAFSSPDVFEFLSLSAQFFAKAPETVLVLWDGFLDAASKKRLGEILLHAAKIQEFLPLDVSKFRRYIAAEALARGIALRPDDYAYLQKFGGDLWALSNELDKMALAKSSPAKGSLMPNGPANIFDLGDMFFTSRSRALFALHAFFDGGEDEFKTFGYLAGHARNLFLVKHCAGLQKKIPASLGIHPFVVKKASSLVRPMQERDLEAGVKRFFEEDFKIKIGRSRPKDSLINMLFS